MQIVDKKLCCGCGVCADVCPKNCIHLDYDEYGFLMPTVGRACVNCGLCKKTCPVLQPVKRTQIQRVYKGYHCKKEEGEDKESSSGAIFPALASQILKEKGLVVGAAFGDGYETVKHVICNSEEEMNKCRGSKYIQSETAGIYKQTKKALAEGRKVLFSGTPCQVAGLKGFLKKEFENLYTADFICHGVASTAYWQSFLKEVSKGQKLSYVSFRNKEKGYLQSGIKIVDDKGKILVESPYREEPIFGKAFANNLVARDSCGTCVYASRSRCADITLADNIIDCTEKERQDGSSFVFINTPKGQALFDAVKEELCVDERETESIVIKMMHLNGPAKPHKDREKLFSAFLKKGIDGASKYVSSYSGKTSSLWIRIKAKIKKLLGK